MVQLDKIRAEKESQSTQEQHILEWRESTATQQHQSTPTPGQRGYTLPASRKLQVEIRQEWKFFFFLPFNLEAVFSCSSVQRGEFRWLWNQPNSTQTLTNGLMHTQRAFFIF